MNCTLLNKNPLELCIFFFAMLQCNFLLNNDITQHCVKVSFVLAFGVFFLLFGVFTQQHIYTTNFYNMASAFIAKPFYSSPRGHANNNSRRGQYKQKGINGFFRFFVVSSCRTQSAANWKDLLCNGNLRSLLSNIVITNWPKKSYRIPSFF